MAKKKSNQIRFAVGSLAEYRSSVWRLWTSKEEVYLAPRDSAGKIKLSAHSSGKIRYAWTEQFATAVLAESENRLLQAWDRPPEDVPGWTKLARVVVPNTETILVQRHTSEMANVEVAWTPTPEPGWFVAFDVYLERGKPQFEISLRPGEAIVGSLRLSGGDYVHLHRMVFPMTEEASAFSIEAARGMRVTFAGDPGVVDASQRRYWTAPNGSPVLFEVPLGRENVVIAPVAHPS